MSRAVIEVLLATTFIVWPIFAWIVVHSRLKRMRNWGISVRDLLVGTLIGVPVVFLLYKIRGFTVQDAWNFLAWYGGGFLYHLAIVSLWIRLFKRFSRGDTKQIT